MGKELAALKAQPAPVQEPVAWMTQARNFVHVMEFTEAEAKLYGWIPVYTTPPAQPAPVQEPLMVDIHPPATQRDRWMYEQGRLAERDPRSHPTPPAEQPAVQEPVAAKDWEGAEYWMPLAWELCANECGEEACTELVWEGGPIPEPWGDRWLKYEDEAKRLIALVQKHTIPPAAQPAVPDAFGTREGEHPQYIEGWNDCRAEMLKGMKP
jgi:hypothetical protein